MVRVWFAASRLVKRERESESGSMARGYSLAQRPYQVRYITYLVSLLNLLCNKKFKT